MLVKKESKQFDYIHQHFYYEQKINITLLVNFTVLKFLKIISGK
jgi:hypothetical protein